MMIVYCVVMIVVFLQGSSIVMVVVVVLLLLLLLLHHSHRLSTIVVAVAFANVPLHPFVVHPPQSVERMLPLVPHFHARHYGRCCVYEMRVVAVTVVVVEVDDDGVAIATMVEKANCVGRTKMDEGGCDLSYDVLVNCCE